MPGSNAGRPPKLTPALTNRIVKMVRSTGNYADAARAAGVTDGTLRRWRRLGEAMADENHPDHPSDPDDLDLACERLSSAVTRAEGEWATGTREAIESAGTNPATKRVTIRRQHVTKEGAVIDVEETREELLPPDWRARAFLLDRHAPPRQAVELTGADGGPVQVDVAARAAEVRGLLAGLTGAATAVEEDDWSERQDGPGSPDDRAGPRPVDADG